MHLQRRLLTILTFSTLAILIGLAFFALPTHRRAAATTYFILTPTPSRTPLPLTIDGTLDLSGQPRLPKIEDLSGRLLFIYDLDLYIAAFDGQPAQLIGENIQPTGINVAPDRLSLVYSEQRRDAFGQNMTVVNLVNLETLSTSTLMTFNGRVNLVRWSPDGAWVAIDLEGVGQGGEFVTLGTLISLRNQPVPPHLIEEYASASWLSDQRLLLLQWGDEALTYAVVDPVTQALELLDFSEDESLTALNIQNITLSDYASAHDLLTTHGLNPIWTPVYPYTPLIGIAPDGSQWVAGETTEEVVCQPYQVVRHTVADNSTTVLAEFSDPYTLRLSNFQWAADDSLYFVRWSSSSCPSQLDFATVQLYRLAPDETPVAISSQLLADIFLHTFGVAADGQTVAWVGYNEQRSYLAMTSIETGDQQELMSVAADNIPDNFFLGVWWLP